MLGVTLAGPLPHPARGSAGRGAAGPERAPGAQPPAGAHPSWASATVVPAHRAVAGRPATLVVRALIFERGDSAVGSRRVLLHRGSHRAGRRHSGSRAGSEDVPGPRTARGLPSVWGNEAQDGCPGVSTRVNSSAATRRGAGATRLGVQAVARPGSPTRSRPPAWARHASNGFSAPRASGPPDHREPECNGRRCGPVPRFGPPTPVENPGRSCGWIPPQPVLDGRACGGGRCGTVPGPAAVE